MNFHRVACCVLCLAIPCYSNEASAELIYGIAAVGNATNLVSFDSNLPESLQSSLFVTGLQPNETIVGIDARPANRKLYAVGSSSRLYTLDPATAAATPVGAQFTPVLNGFSYGIDFDPTTDRLRVISDTRKNRVINPDTGAVESVGNDLTEPADPLDPNPVVVHVAYDHNEIGAMASELFGIDAFRGMLLKVNANSGAVTQVSSLSSGGFAGTLGGFDISGATGIAYVAIPTTSSNLNTLLFKLNLSNGVLSNETRLVGGGLILTSLTVESVPEPASAMLMAASLILCRRQMRRQ